MSLNNILKQVIIDQQSTISTKTVERTIPDRLINSKEILVISGIRRCGKSTLLQQIRSKQKEKDFFLNFDDERLFNFSVNDFQILYEIFVEFFGEQHTFYFDEIQNIHGWELFVRRLYDSGNKIFVTGSNANMLSRELGTHLTGRYIQFELYPFSFEEYLKLSNVSLKEQNFYSTPGIANLKRNFNNYFQKGGFPQYMVSSNDLFLKSLYESILYKDVMVRNNLTNEKEILELVYYLVSNVAKTSTYNSLKSVIGVKHTNTIKNYIEFIENTYLFFQVYKFDYSLKKQLANPRKTYVIDNALVNKLGFNFSDNMGRLLENLIFIELKRRGMEIYYHSNPNFECDFILIQNEKITEVLQVCSSISDEKTKQREINGLLDALNSYNLKEGTIITMEEEGTIEMNGKFIFIKQAWKWLLHH